MLPDQLTIPDHIISRFFVAGINYQKADLSTRSLFAIDNQCATKVLEDAGLAGIRSAFLLSTCNRTEVYAYCQHEQELTDILVKHTRGTAEQFESLAYRKRGHQALRHLFEVAAGLDSQIIGDNEILGQLKTSIALSRECQMIGPIMDRTLNFALQAAKSIKTKTQISTGTVSVSYAAIEWLNQNEKDAVEKILVYGTGKFGRNVAKNIRHYFPSSVLNVINRTDSVAETFASEAGISWVPYAQLESAVSEANVILVCTNATEHTLIPRYFEGGGKKTILDLSVPLNVHPAVKQIPGIRVADVDEVSVLMHETLEARKAEMPRAQEMVAEYIQEFVDWLAMYQHSARIQDMKQKLFSLNGWRLAVCEMATREESHYEELQAHISKTVNNLAHNLRNSKEKGCLFIHAYRNFLEAIPAHHPIIKTA